MDEGRKRLEYLRKDPRVTLTVLDDDNWYTHLSVQGRVVEMRDDAELADADRLARRYLGMPYRSASVGESAPGSRWSAGTGGALPRIRMSSTTESGTAWSTTWGACHQVQTSVASLLMGCRRGSWPNRKNLDPSLEPSVRISSEPMPNAATRSQARHGTSIRAPGWAVVAAFVAMASNAARTAFSAANAPSDQHLFINTPQ
jgi:hypothetical protein